MKTITGISGSLRAGSYNSSLLRAAADVAPAGIRLQFESLRNIPLYDGDAEAEYGIPEPVSRLKDLIAAADGLMIATPEYNNSMPGVLKNAIDWLSRPGDDIPRVFHDKPVAVLGATPGGFGTVHAQQAWLPVLRTLRTRPWFGGQMLVSKAGDLFDQHGKLTDEPTRERLERYMSDFAGFIGR